MKEYSRASLKILMLTREPEEVPYSYLRDSYRDLDMKPGPRRTKYGVGVRGGN
jgi:hypothetical protein